MRLLSIRARGHVTMGFQLARKPGMLVINEIRDFVRGGFIAYPGLRGIRVTEDAPSTVWHRGVKLLGIEPRLPKIPLRSFSLPALLRHLERTREMTMVTFCRRRKSESFFGEIREVGADHFVGAFFSTTGKFMRKPDRIEFSEVTEVQWDSTYERAMMRVAAATGIGGCGRKRCDRLIGPTAS